MPGLLEKIPGKGGAEMRYKNGKEYSFTASNGIKVVFELENFSEKTVETFTRLSANEALKDYKRKGGTLPVDDFIVA